MKKVVTVLIKILRLLAVVFFIGIIAAYIFVPFSDMPEGIRSFVTLLKHSLNVKGNPPLILLILWFALLIAEIPFALELKDENNVFADDQRQEDIKTKPAEKKKETKAKAEKTKTEKKPEKRKIAEKQDNWETAKPVNRKSSEKKPAEKKPAEKKTAEKKQPKMQPAKTAKAQKPVKAPEKPSAKSAAVQSRPAKAAAAVPYSVNTKTAVTKAPYEPVKEKQKLYDDEDFEQFLNDLKQDYLSK